MLIPIVYYAIIDKKNNRLSFPFKSFTIFSIILFLYLFYLINSFENYFTNYPEYNFFFKDINILKNVSFHDLLILLKNYVFTIIPMYLLLFLFLYKIKITNKKINLSLDIFFKFLIFSLILLIPFILEFEKLIKSVFFFSKSLVFTQSSENIFFLNLFKTIKSFYNLNYFYLIFYIIVLTFFINFYLKKKIIFSNEFKVFFFASIQIFLFYFFYKKFNIGSNIAVSLLLISLIIFIDNNKFVDNKNIYYLINTFFILAIIFPLKDNFYKYYYYQISTFKIINHLEKDINSYLNKKHKQYEILICKKNMSFLKFDKIKILSHKECKKISKLPFKKNQLLILRSDQIRDHYDQEIKNLIRQNNAYLLKKFNYSFNWSNYIYKERINIYELIYG